MKENNRRTDGTPTPSFDSERPDNWKEMLDHIPGGIAEFLCDGEMALLYANTGFYRIVGYDRQDFADKGTAGILSLLLPKETVSVLRENAAEQLSRGSIVRLEFCVTRKSGDPAWIQMTGSIRRTGSRADLLYCILLDITKEKMLRQEQQMEQQRYRIITEQLDDVFFEYNFQNDTVYTSSKWEKLFGYSLPQRHVRSAVFSGGIVHPEDRRVLLRFFYRACLHRRSSGVEVRFRRADGEYVWVGINVTVIKNGAGNPIKAIGKIADIDASKREREQLISKAQRDPLTKLYNRSAMENSIASCLRVSQPGMHHALMIIDIDNFKRVNDSLGHLYGDTVLTEIALKLRTLFRSADLVGRFGGDEFLIFLKNVGSRSNVERKARLVCGIFREIYPQGHENYIISGSIGVSIFPEHGKNYLELFAKADSALYAAKFQGKNGYAIYQGGQSEDKEKNGGRSPEETKDGK